jgi:lipoxygenase homology domain-containing protein 1
VYYTAALGVVMNVVTNTQRFFHGHNDNIKSMACHPNDWIIATGQTKKAGPEEVPYVCVWETRECKEVRASGNLLGPMRFGASLANSY